MKTLRIVGLVLASAVGVLAQDGMVSDPLTESQTGPILDSLSLSQKQAAYDAENEPHYRSREPARTHGTPLERLEGGVMISPDKTTRGAAGDW
jgi:hypothetical protein